MIKRISQGIKKRRFLLQWQKVDRLMSKGKYEQAIQILSKIKAPQNYKSICIARMGDCYLHIGRLREAESSYRLAIKTEMAWDGRPNKENKKYILVYCEFFLATIFAREGDKRYNEEYPKLLQKLRKIPASRLLVNHVLPVPRSIQ